MGWNEDSLTDKQRLKVDRAKQPAIAETLRAGKPAVRVLTLNLDIISKNVRDGKYGILQKSAPASSYLPERDDL